MTATANRPGAALTQWQSRASDSFRDVGLRLVRPVQSRARRAPFVVVVLTVLAVGLVGLIIISTTLQNLAFQQAELDREVTILKNERDALQHDVDRLYTPSAIASRADQLGMVHNTNPAFLRLSDNEVLGKPVPAEKDAK